MPFSRLRSCRAKQLASAILSTTPACNDAKPLPFRAISDEARRVEIHCPAGVGSIRRPIWQASMIGIPGPCKAYPSSTHLFGKNEGGRITATVMIADLSIVKDEGDFGSMEWTGAVIQGRRPPSICRKTLVLRQVLPSEQPGRMRGCAIERLRSSPTG